MTTKTHALAWLDAVAHAPISTAAKAVALAMATHADYATGHNMRAGTARLAWMAGLQERQTRTMVGELRDAGLIEWDGIPTAPGRARTYALTIPNGGNVLPPSSGQRRQPTAAVTAATAAMDCRNGGNTAPQRRQPIAAHQGPTRARTQLASNAARETRGDDAPGTTLDTWRNAVTGREPGCIVERLELIADENVAQLELQLADGLELSCEADADTFTMTQLEVTWQGSADITVTDATRDLVAQLLANVPARLRSTDPLWSQWPYLDGDTVGLWLEGDNVEPYLEQALAAMRAVVAQHTRSAA